MYRYILRESCSQFDSLPLTYSRCAPLDDQLAKAEAWLTRMNSVVAQKDKQAAKKKTRAGREKAAKKVGYSWRACVLTRR
jgi:hypothetical protein